MITLTLARKDGYTSAFVKPQTLVLPATKYDFQDVLERLGLEEIEECVIKNVTTDLNELDFIFEFLVFDIVEISLLNLLAMYLIEFSSHEIEIFEALVYKNMPLTIIGLINQTLKFENVCLLDIKSKNQLGKFLAKEDVVEIPKKFKKYTDYKKVAKKYLAKNNCKLTPQGFIDDGREKADFWEENAIDELNNIHDSVLETHEKVAIVVHIEPKENTDSKRKTKVMINLPVSNYDIINAITETGATNLEEVKITKILCRNKVFDDIFDENINIEKLNQLARALINLEYLEELPKFKAILEFENVIGATKSEIINNDNIEKVIAVAKNSNNYIFYPLKMLYREVHGYFKHTSYGLVASKKEMR